MHSDNSEKSELFQWAVGNWEIIALVLFLLVQIAAAFVYMLEALGAPRWAAIIAVALLPVVAWLVVSLSNRGQNLTSLVLGGEDPRARTASQETGRRVDYSRFQQSRDFGKKDRFIGRRRAAGR